MVESESFGADPARLHPCDRYDHICFIKNAVTHPDIEIGDYTYYSDLVHPAEDFQKNNVLYLDQFHDKLIIGRYCAIASGTKFIMNAANHKLASFTTYPFKIFDARGWGGGERTREDIHYKGDLVIGNDVWLGYDVLVLPGARIGDGAIIGARAVVTGTIPPYAIAAGNPARVIRMRFDEETVALLRKLAWWTWAPRKVAEHLDVLTGDDPEALRRLAAQVM